MRRICQLPCRKPSPISASAHGLPFFIILLIRKLLLIEKYRNISAIHLVGLKDSKWSTLCCYDIFVVYKWAVFWRLPLSWRLAYADGHINSLCFFRGVDYVKKCEVEWKFSLKRDSQNWYLEGDEFSKNTTVVSFFLRVYAHKHTLLYPDILCHDIPKR